MSLTTNTNPGCTNPADQTYTPVRTNPIPPPASTAVITSNGEQQRRENQPTPKAVSTGRGLPQDVLAGSTSQDRGLTAVRAVSTGQGPHIEAFPGSANLARNISPEEAACTPPATDVNACSGHPGGLAVNVNIK
jgi:hypothetical protein